MCYITQMPITSSAKKAQRASKKKAVYNIRRKKGVDTVVHEIKKLIKANKKEEATKLLSKNTASRKKSRLSKFIKNSK